MAWLHAVPQPDERSRRADPKFKRATVSRIDQLKRDKIPVPMPPNPMPHLIAWLIEIGLSEAAGMGAVPISWREINEWQRATGVTLSPWEARLIRSLSAAYVAESKRAESENCPSPWKSEVTQREIDMEIQQLSAIFG